MSPEKFRGANLVYAEDQPPYSPMPAHLGAGVVTTRWRLTLLERLRVALTGRLWLQALTFDRPPQPVRLSASRPATGEGVPQR